MAKKPDTIERVRKLRQETGCTLAEAKVILGLGASDNIAGAIEQLVKPKRPISGTKEWAVHSVNCVTGCEHDCRYCYARYNAIHRFGGIVKDREEWVQMQVRDKDVNKSRKLLDGRIMFPTTHDITPFVLEPCLIVLDKLLAAGNQVLIVSKPHLMCVKEMCKRLKAYRDQIMFRFTIGSDDDAFLAYWEPGAPCFGERISALKFAYKAGYQTSVSVEPMLDAPNIRRLFLKVKRYVTDSIWIGKLNKARQRCAIETPTDEDQVSLIEATQADDKIHAIYAVLKDEPKVRWKESIKSVVGLPSNEVAGMDE